ncbi:MAG: septum site-determining protein MinC [Lachnospiraceae bacterium]|nr:septum site-determining protein MinC [Lachnospiraceae bacterium]
MNSVVIKGNKYGISIVMDEALEYEAIKEELKQKLLASKKFFKKASMAVSFEGKQLSDEEQYELVSIIEENSEMSIVCIMDNDPLKEEQFKTLVENVTAPVVEEIIEPMPQPQMVTESIINDSGQFYKGTLRSGQSLESATSIVILGDVNPGANIVANGNIVILGTLKGNAYAGANGNENAIVVALEMQPMQIRIADIIARCADKPEKAKNPTAKIAFVEDGNIYIEKLDKDIIADINL